MKMIDERSVVGTSYSTEASLGVIEWGRSESVLTHAFSHVRLQ